MGRPKALVRSPEGEPWVARGVRTLQDAGCGRVVVVLGAEAAAARALLPAAEPARTSPTVVVAPDWTEGIGASLRAGLAALEPDPGGSAARFAVVTLVDLPELSAEAIRRVANGATADSLRQAFYAGRPGHPVLIGADHFAELRAALHGDVGARPYLRAHGAQAVDCTDLGGGDDVDELPLGER